MILRYDNPIHVRTKIDPLTDICSWVSGLRSIEYTADILKEIHGFRISKDIRMSAKAISAHAEYAVNFLEQAWSGPRETVFLPTYYSLLNLAKIYIILSGRLKELRSQRWHGASYVSARKLSHDLMTEEISIKPKGAIPLFYYALTGSKIPVRGVKIKMGELYPFIHCISHEYCTIYKKSESRVSVDLDIEGSDKDGYNLVVKITKFDKRNFSENDLKFFVSLSQDSKRKSVFRSKKIKCSPDEAGEKLIRFVRRYLICTDIDALGNVEAFTYISRKRFLLPEEIPILLTFFHMSNIVRYNPEFLEKLKESKAWALLLVHPKTTTLAFLELFWSYVNKSVYRITT